MKMQLFGGEGSEGEGARVFKGVLLLSERPQSHPGGIESCMTL